MALEKDLRIRVKVDRNTGELKVIGQDLEHIERASKKSSSSVSLLESHIGKLGAVIGTALSIKELANYADTWNLLEGRLKLVTSSTQNLTDVQTLLFDIAQRSRVGYEQTADLYARIARATESLGVSQNDTLSVTEAISKSLIISGASAESANAALIQLGQGFASGVLRGEELNSVLEQAPRLAQAIADGMGITVGQLRQMGTDGKLTADAVFNAIQKQKDAIEKEFGQMPQTIGQSLTMLENEFMKLVGSIDDSMNGSGGVTDIIAGVSDFLKTNQDDIGEYARIVFEGVLTLTKDIASSIGDLLSFAGGLFKDFAGWVVSLSGDASNKAIDNFGFFDYFALGVKTALTGIGILFDGLKQLVNYAQMAYSYVSGDDAGVAKARAYNLELMANEDKRIDELINSYDRLAKTKKNTFTDKPYSPLTDLDKKGKNTTPKNVGGDNKKKSEAEKAAERAEKLNQRANSDIDTKIYNLTHSEHEKAMRNIELEIAKYREAKVSETKIAEYKAAAIKELTDKEAKEKEELLAKELKEREQANQKLLQIEEQTYLEMNEFSNNWVDNELYNIGKRTSEMAEAGMEMVKIEEYANKAIENITTKRDKEITDNKKKEMDELNKSTIQMQTVFEDAFRTMEDSLVTMFQNGKFEADQFFNAIIEGLIRMQIRNFITQPLTNAIGGFFASAEGNAFDGGHPVMAFANGGAFTNSIVSQPTVAPMALFGEAGPEAIMPLTRIGGTLGVKAIGGNSQQNVTVNIENKTNTPVSEDNVRVSTDINGTVVNIVLDAINRNKNGLRDSIKGVR